MIKKLIKAKFNQVFRKKQIEAHLKSLSYDGDSGETRFSYQHPEFASIVQALVCTYQKCGGPNFLEMAVFDPAEMKSYTVMVRPHTGHMPSMIIATLRKALEEICTGVGDSHAIAQKALKACGYLPGVELKKPAEYREGDIERFIGCCADNNSEKERGNSNGIKTNE